MQEKLVGKTTETQQQYCFHCGETCRGAGYKSEEKVFCCEGCRMVYHILNDHQLCDYYELNNRPGQTQTREFRSDKFAFLDNSAVSSKLISFKDENHTHLTFYIPQIHCSSCLYLLEKLYRIEASVISSSVNFDRREVTIIFNSHTGSVRKMAELLTSIGYEPYISLNDLNDKKPAVNRQLIYQLGVAGFCFGNIMLMSFPEYFGIEAGEEGLQSIFRWLNFVLALPVLLYSSQPFFASTIKSLKHRYLHIDTPIALAILITFIRSSYELFSGSGAGYFDSMTGIVFFMLAGRILQDKTYRQLSFDRDYTSYFPIAVTVKREKTGRERERETETGTETETETGAENSVAAEESAVPLPEIKAGDTIIIHNEELIPVDGLLTRGAAVIDYSFVTGESIPVVKNIGELVYAGGRQTSGRIEILVMKEVAQSYLTGLWSRGGKEDSEAKRSFVHRISKWFTWVVFAIAGATAVYWQMHDATRTWPAVTAIFIIACPCALLLANSFTNGNILRILSRNGFFLRNAQTIESIAAIDHIVFDKTGTLTAAGETQIKYEGISPDEYSRQLIRSAIINSVHPLSKTLSSFLDETKIILTPDRFKETPGYGIIAEFGGDRIQLGSQNFVCGKKTDGVKETAVYFSLNGELQGRYIFSNQYRKDLGKLIRNLNSEYSLSVVSGDQNTEQMALKRIFGKDTCVLFNHHPTDKLHYVEKLQKQGKRVMMIGDGLNDAGALMQSDCGIAVSESTSYFTPSSDAILKASAFQKLWNFIRICRANRVIVSISFIISIAYNIAGLFFAVQGNLSPLIGAILMPCSSFTILLITFGSTNMLAARLRL